MHAEIKPAIHRDLLLEAMDLATLTQNQRLTFSLRYFPREPWTLKAIGNVIGVSSQRVGQIEAVAKRILRGTMANTLGKDLFLQWFSTFGNCSISGEKQDQLQGFLERNKTLSRTCSSELFYYSLPQSDQDKPLTSDHFQHIVSSRVSSMCELLPEKERRPFLSDLRNLSFTLSDGSFDDAFGRAMKERKLLEPRSERRTGTINVSF
ncbi:MAG TPA: sigma factor-like helix-turn-helix DNA-binding protein [Candidatus Baltobacteraceae bacterium]|jgi:hypothetical protein|nr:sigma factor-like helix-turn-helix DNA-binding protein [Candidatus Baltobacteraceae bacterium]